MGTRSQVKESGVTSLRNGRAARLARLMPSFEEDSEEAHYLLPEGQCPFVKLGCPAGHTWTAIAGSPASYQCPACQPIPRQRRSKGHVSLSALQDVAQRRGGRPLSMPRAFARVEEDQQSEVPLNAMVTWQCAEGHTWTSKAVNVVKRGFWCRSCAAKERLKGRQLTIQDMQDTARAFGGRCLSDEYKGSASKLQWECAEGHVFWKTPNNVRRRQGYASWCTICAGKERREKRRLGTPDTAPLSTQLPASLSPSLSLHRRSAALVPGNGEGGRTRGEEPRS